MHCNAEFYYVGTIPRTATRGFKMVLFTASRGNNFVGGTCAPPSALVVICESVDWFFQTLKQYAADIALALTCSKQRYQLALDNLESISDEVHEQRRLVLPPRTPGVGAEAVDDLSNWPSVNIGNFAIFCL